jgi:hypothetical protein
VKVSVPSHHHRRVDTGGLDHIPDDVVPALRKSGVSDEQIRKLTVDNPRKVFEQAGCVLTSPDDALAAFRPISGCLEGAVVDIRNDT